MWGPLVFVLGVIASPWILYRFLAVIPGGPHVQYEVLQMPTTGTNASSCRAFSVSIVSDKPLKELHAEIQFPAPISDYDVGTPSVQKQVGLTRFMGNIDSFGTNADGTCNVGKTLVHRVDASTAQHILSISASTVQENLPILGAVTVPDSAVSADPYVAIDYEYRVWGESVEKRIISTAAYTTVTAAPQHDWTRLK